MGHRLQMPIGHKRRAGIDDAESELDEWRQKLRAGIIGRPLPTIGDEYLALRRRGFSGSS